jgi:hypothetical protein
MVTRPEITAPPPLPPETPLGPVVDIEFPHATDEAASAARTIHWNA